MARAAPPAFAELVTVLTSTDPSRLALARSLFDSAGIPCFAKGEGLQDLFAAGRIGTGFSTVVGPVELQVDRSRADEARALLAQADAGGLDDSALEAAWASSAPDESQAPPVRPPGRGLGVFRGLVLAELALLFVNDLLGGSLAADAPTEVRAFLETLHYSRTLRDLGRDLYPFVLVLSVVASLGLLVPWPLARHLYLISWAWALFQNAIGGGSFASASRRFSRPSRP